MKKVKYNYAVVKSRFGNIWVGKTKLPVVKDRIYADISEAIKVATELLLERNPSFDPYDEDADDIDYETFDSYNAIQEVTAENAEDAIEEFIVRR